MQAARLRWGPIAALALAGCSDLIGVDDWEGAPVASASSASSASSAQATAGAGGGGGGPSSSSSSTAATTGQGGGGAGASLLLGYTLSPAPNGDGMMQLYPDDAHDPDAAVVSQGDLTDGLHGTPDVVGSKAAWVGWYATDGALFFSFEALVTISDVSVGMLRESAAAIEPPAYVTILASPDGASYSACVSSSPVMADGTRADFMVSANCSGRFFEVLLKNGVVVPSGWIFTDEISFFVVN